MSQQNGIIHESMMEIYSGYFKHKRLIYVEYHNNLIKVYFHIRSTHTQFKGISLSEG